MPIYLDDKGTSMLRNLDRRLDNLHKKSVYIVYDTTGAYLAQFKSWKSANEFRIANGRYDWIIK